jgi:plastocyanin
MPQCTARLSILSGSVGRNYDAHEDLVEHAREGHAGYQGISQRGALTSALIDSGKVRSGESDERSIMVSRSTLLFPKLKLLCVAVLLLAAVMLATRLDRPLAASPPIVIKMLDVPPSFQPVRTTIRAGDTVEWKNVGNEVHHATSDPSLAIKKNDVTNPPGAKSFDSGFIKPGESFSQTFSVPGIYRYTCVVHEAKGMTGELVVQK